MKRPLMELLFSRSYECRSARRLFRHGVTFLILVMLSVIFTFGLSPVYAFTADFMVLIMTVVHTMYGRLSFRIGRLEN
jgi:hypothetical protein